MIQIGNIVELDDNKEYLLLEEVTINNVKFMFAVRTENKAEITDDTVIFEVVNENGEEFLSPVEDKELYDLLMDEFKDVLAEKIDALPIVNEEVTQ